MSRKNGGIIGPANTPVGGLFKGVAGGVWRMNDVANFVGNSQWPTGPQSIDNSLRFDDGSSDYLSRTPSSAGNRKTFTISAWVKRGQVTATSDIMSAWSSNADSGHFLLRFDSAERLDVSTYSTNVLTTSRLFRDSSAWYHIVCAVDTTSGTADQRVRLYVNGVEETSFSTRNNPSQDADLEINNSSIQVIGANYYSSSAQSYADGYMAEFVLIDGQALDPTSFGEFDSTTGIWKPKKIGSFTSAGDNSFYLDFKDSSNVGNDASGLNNDFTVNNLTSIDQSTDTCVLNYATLVNASSASKTYTLSEGNLKVTASASNWYGVPRGNIGVSSGKWYFEVKVTDENDYFVVGYMSATNLADVGDRATNGYPKLNGFQSSGYIKRQDGTEVNVSSSFQWNDGDIAQIALDMDNKKLWIGKNGSYYNSGDPSAGSNETVGSSYFTSGETYLPAINFYATNDGSFNFGSPPYSISSGNSDANGFGNFEYAVPSGYYALNTTNLNTYG